jgi:hypothetical protein
MQDCSFSPPTCSHQLQGRKGLSQSVRFDPKCPVTDADPQLALSSSPTPPLALAPTYLGDGEVGSDLVAKLLVAEEHQGKAQSGGRGGGSAPLSSCTDQGNLRPSDHMSCVGFWLLCSLNMATHEHDLYGSTYTIRLVPGDTLVQVKRTNEHRAAPSCSVATCCHALAYRRALTQRSQRSEKSASGSGRP